MKTIAALYVVAVRLGRALGLHPLVAITRLRAALGHTSRHTLSDLMTHVNYRESVRRHIALRHPDEMRRGRKRHRKRAWLRFARHMAPRDRALALAAEARRKIDERANPTPREE